MAHLPDDTLPSQFDAVVDGTGLVQTMVAAGLTRAGRSVLHVDRNAYYGELWGTLMHRELHSWIEEHSGQSHDQSDDSPHVQATQSHDQPCDQPCDQGGSPQDEGESDERAIELKYPLPSSRVTNLVETIHEITDVSPLDNTTNDQGPPQASPDSTQPPAADDSVAPHGDSEVDVQADTQGGGATGEQGEQLQGAGSAGDDDAAGVEPQSSRVTWQSLESQWRRFNYDIMPKLLYCRGALVNLLTQSNCGRYLEFKAVNKIFTHMNGKTEQVPCSRSDVFSSKSVSMLEKRRMMKFLTFCAEFEKRPEEYEEFVSMPYVDFLKLKDLTPNLIHYILHCIAMVNEQASTLEGLKATQIFLNSLGRFGNAPFLCPVYGAGELPQAFCRLCAVFGGVYCLRRHIQSLLVSRTENKATGFVCSTGQKIACLHVVTSAALVKESLDFRECLSTTKLSRGIFVADGPIQDTERRLTVLTFPPCSLGSAQTVMVYLLQLDPYTNCTAEGTYMFHMLCPSVNGTAQQDLECVAKSLFKIEDQAECNSAGPRLLWSLYFNINVCTVNQAETASLDIPRNVHVVSDPDGTIAYENAVKEAQIIFERICPGEEFLPFPPDPEDIIYEDNPGDNAGNEESVPTGGSDGVELPPEQDTTENTGQSGEEVEQGTS